MKTLTKLGHAQEKMLNLLLDLFHLVRLSFFFHVGEYRSCHQSSPRYNVFISLYLHLLLAKHAKSDIYDCDELQLAVKIQPGYKLVVFVIQYSLQPVASCRISRISTSTQKQDGRIECHILCLDAAGKQFTHVQC